MGAAYTLTALTGRCTVNTKKVCGDHLQWLFSEGAGMTRVQGVVITGVSTGIGLETTRLLISKGYRVFGSVRKQSDADRLQKEMGDRYVPLILDVTDADAIQRASEKVGALLGSNRLAGLVNNAGMVVSGPLLHLRPSEFRRQLEANMAGPLMVTQAFAPLLGTDKKRTGRWAALSISAPR
jgi:hypothetical protein